MNVVGGAVGPLTDSVVRNHAIKALGVTFYLDADIRCSAKVTKCLSAIRIYGASRKASWWIRCSPPLVVGPTLIGWAWKLDAKGVPLAERLTTHTSMPPPATAAALSQRPGAAPFWSCYPIPRSPTFRELSEGSAPLVASNWAKSPLNIRADRG